MIQAVAEYNGGGYLIYAENFAGAFVRGKTKDEALSKFESEIKQYAHWAGLTLASDFSFDVRIVQEKESGLQICDADSDVIFDSEKLPLIRAEYGELKALALKSARDFLALYESVPNKTGTVLSPRKTFYGNMPLTADEMYSHTKNVNSYYFGEIGTEASNLPDILSCRREGFAKLESSPFFLENAVYDGSYGEQWSLRKVCRRFIWHDRIHAKAIYKMSVKLCGKNSVSNPFCFNL